MSAAIDIASWIMLVAGAGFCIIGGIGLLRMPDFYARTHAAGITDTLGAGLLLLGLVLQAGPTLIAMKLLLILGFLELVGPTSGHALFKAAYADGVKVHEGADIVAQVAEETARAAAVVEEPAQTDSEDGHADSD